MGFLEGLKQVGAYFQSLDHSGSGGGLASLRNFLEYPMELPDQKVPDNRRPQVIRVALDVEDPTAEQLQIRGVKDISLADYPGLANGDVINKYLYREPVGSNVTWSFSPIYKLGKGMGEKAYFELTGMEEPGGPVHWKQATKSRFFKLYSRVLKGFEDSGCFAPGGADCVMNGLVEQAGDLARLWEDKKRSFLLLFGAVSPDGEFLFPGDLPAFQKHFRDKFANGARAAARASIRCALCHQTADTTETLDKVFKFSTFDKVGFLPGMDRNNADKVFPICTSCYGLLTRGVNEVESRFQVDIGLSKLKIVVVPEMIGAVDLMKRMISPASDYLIGFEDDQRLLENLARRDSSFVYHFLFLETNQAQLILHRLVEDVPPTQFRKLQRLWTEMRKRFYPDAKEIPGLDAAVKILMAQVLSLSGKSEADKLVMREQGLGILAALFGNEQVDVDALKRAAVARLPGLFCDQDWLSGKTNRISGGLRLESLLATFEFLVAANKSIDQQEAEPL